MFLKDIKVTYVKTSGNYMAYFNVEGLYKENYLNGTVCITPGMLFTAYLNDLWSDSITTSFLKKIERIKKSLIKNSYFTKKKLVNILLKKEEII